MSNVIKEVKLSDNNGMIVHLQQYAGEYIEERYMHGMFDSMAGTTDEGAFEEALIVYTKRMGMHVVL